MIIHPEILKKKFSAYFIGLHTRYSPLLGLFDHLQVITLLSLAQRSVGTIRQKDNKQCKTQIPLHPSRSPRSVRAVGRPSSGLLTSRLKSVQNSVQEAAQERSPSAGRPKRATSKCGRTVDRNLCRILIPQQYSMARSLSPAAVIIRAAYLPAPMQSIVA